jgi:hypothetical protein
MRRALERQMPSDQLGAHLTDVFEALRCLNKSLFILDLAGLSMAAIHVDAAINCLHDELGSQPNETTKLEASQPVDFSTLDAMALSVYSHV